MDERLPAGPLPAADHESAGPIPASGERSAVEAERQAAAETAATPEGPARAQPTLPPRWEDDDGLDTAFAPTLPPEAVRFGEAAPVAPICQWCNARLPSADVAQCPSCGVRLQPVEGTPELPGLTMPATPAAPRPAVPTAPNGGFAPGGSGGQNVVPGWPAPAASQPPRPVTAPPVMPRDPSAYEGLTAEEIQLLSNSSAALRQEITQLNSREAFEPPTRDVRQAMLEIEFEADRADPMRIVDPGPLSDRRTLEPPV